MTSGHKEFGCLSFSGPFLWRGGPFRSSPRKRKQFFPPTIVCLLDFFLSAGISRRAEYKSRAAEKNPEEKPGNERERIILKGGQHAGPDMRAGAPLLFGGGGGGAPEDEPNNVS